MFVPSQKESKTREVGSRIASRLLQEKIRFLQSIHQKVRDTFNVFNQFLRTNDPWQIDSNNIQVRYNKKLGSGAFADVFVGRLHGDAGIKTVYPDTIALARFCDCKVAVKALPVSADDLARNDFVQVGVV